jgi:PhoH-like ATPase
MTLKNSKKLFIVDTSVLLYDKSCIENFKGNDVVIPLVVLEELDKFKSREGILGENSRYFNRFLDELRSNGSLHDGIYLEDLNTSIRIESNNCWEGLTNLDSNSNDNLIIATANYLRKNNESYEDIIVITKDINLRVKCDAINIAANDYYADYEFLINKNIFLGINQIEVERNVIDDLYNNKHIVLRKIPELTEVCENECVVLKSKDESSSALAIRKFNSLVLATSKQDIFKKTKLEAKNKEQIFALNLLLDENISLMTMTGVPGSGKTYLALMTALSEIEKEKKKRIIFTRPIQTVGKDIGFLPGSLSEKMAPWLSPIVDNFRNQFGDLTYFNMMMEKGIIDVAPLSYIRGRSFNDAIIIVDEAQNATVHELKTVITRTGKNSKIILLGDIEQVDLPYINKYSNGLTIVIEKLKKENLVGHIHFEKGYRSDLANIAAKLL